MLSKCREAIAFLFRVSIEGKERRARTSNERSPSLCPFDRVKNDRNSTPSSTFSAPVDPNFCKKTPPNSDGEEVKNHDAQVIS